MNGRAVQRFCLALMACLALAACSNNNSSTGVPVGQTGFVVLRLDGTTGALDPAFGGSGTVVTDLDPGQFDFALAVALQPSDGKILSAGRTVFQGLNSIALVRQNTNGALDGTFGTGGIVRTPIVGVSTGASAIAVQGDGKILVAAISFSQGLLTTSITLVRYTSVGALDPAFATGGIVTTASLGPGADSDTCGLALQPDGKIVVAGASSNGKISLYRYDATGALDTAGFGTAGTGGVTVTDLAAPAMSPAIALQADNKIVLVGGKGSFSGTSSPVDEVVLRYNTDGQLDTTFGGTGIVTTDIDFKANFGNALLIQPADQKIVTVGHANVNFSTDTSDISLVRYNTNGTLDVTFGPTQTVPGIVTTDLGGFDNAFSIALQAGKFIVAGNSGSGGLASVAVLRYNADGSLDSTFGTSGVVAPPPVGPSFISSGNGVVVQPGGNIVVAGYD